MSSPEQQGQILAEELDSAMTESFKDRGDYIKAMESVISYLKSCVDSAKSEDEEDDEEFEDDDEEEDVQ